METKKMYKWLIYKAIGRLMTDKVGEAFSDDEARKIAADYRKNTGYIGSLKKVRTRTQ